MTEIIGETKVKCSVCGGLEPLGVMLGVKSGNFYHIPCILSFCAEMLDSTLRKREMDRTTQK
jgi:hypothetical protein